MDSLYVCLFSNGHIKVGRSISPDSRIAQHADRVSCMGVELVDSHTYGCMGSAPVAESALIARCDEQCSQRFKNEWFAGLDYPLVCLWASELAALDLKADRHDALDRALEMLGGTNAAARTLGVSAPTVSQWVTKVRPVPPAQAVAMERLVEGYVTVEDLCPLSKWQRVPDAGWPHVSGRPLLDLAGA